MQMHGITVCEATFTNLRKACHVYEQSFMTADMELIYKKTEYIW